MVPPGGDLAKIAHTGDLPSIVPLRSGAAPEGATSLPHAADVVSVLEHIHPEDATTLLRVLDPQETPATTAQTATLVVTLVEQAQAGKADHVDGLVRQIAQHSAAVAESLPDRADLIAVRPEITATIRHLVVSEKADAEHALTSATTRIQDLSRPSGPYHTEPKALIELCEKLIAFGGLTNYRKAQRLASSIIPGTDALIDHVVPTDITEAPILDGRGLPRHFPRQFDLLERGPALAGILLLLCLLLIAAIYLFR